MAALVAGIAAAGATLPGALAAPASHASRSSVRETGYQGLPLTAYVGTTSSLSTLEQHLPAAFLTDAHAAFPDPSRLLNDLAPMFSPGVFVSAQVGSPPAENPGTDDPSVPTPTGWWQQRWGYITVNVPDAGGGTVGPTADLAFWQAELAAGVVRDELNLRGYGDLFGLTITGVLPNGTHVPLGGGIGAIAHGQNFSDPSASQVSSAITTAASTLGLTIQSVTPWYGMQIAPAVVASTSDPAGFVANYDSNIATLFQTTTDGVDGDPDIPAYEGYYFELHDSSNGSLVAVTAVDFRTGASVSWVSPNL